MPETRRDPSGAGTVEVDACQIGGTSAAEPIVTIVCFSLMRRRVDGTQLRLSLMD
jgi:hypothetical protein